MLVELVISLYVASLENPENQNSEIAANTTGAGTSRNCTITLSSSLLEHFDK